MSALDIICPMAPGRMAWTPTRTLMTAEERARLSAVAAKSKPARVALPIPATWRPRAPTMNRLRMLGLDPKGVVIAFRVDMQASKAVSASGWSKRFEAWLKDYRAFRARAQRETRT